MFTSSNVKEITKDVLKPAKVFVLAGSQDQFNEDEFKAMHVSYNKVILYISTDYFEISFLLGIYTKWW